MRDSLFIGHSSNKLFQINNPEYYSPQYKFLNINSSISIPLYQEIPLRLFYLKYQHSYSHILIITENRFILFLVVS